MRENKVSRKIDNINWNFSRNDLCSYKVLTNDKLLESQKMFVEIKDITHATIWISQTNKNEGYVN